MRRELKFLAGLVIGLGFGAAIDNLGVGIAIGIVFGAAFSQNKNEQKSTKSDSSEKDVVIDLNQMNRRKRKAKNGEKE